MCHSSCKALVTDCVLSISINFGLSILVYIFLEYIVGIVSFTVILRLASFVILQETEIITVYNHSRRMMFITTMLLSLQNNEASSTFE